MFPSQTHVYKDKADRETLGQKLKLARLEAGLSQMEATRKAGLITEAGQGKFKGVTKGFLSYVEEGSRGITSEQLRRLAKAYNVPYAWLVGTTPLTRAEKTRLDKLSSKITRGRTPQRIVEAPKQVVPLARTPRAGKTRTSKVASEATSKVPEFTAAVPALTPPQEKLLGLTQGLNEVEMYWLLNGVEKIVAKLRQGSPTSR